MASNVTTKEDLAKAEKAARDAKVEARQKELDAENAKLGKEKGPRKFVGTTRGKNPQMVEFLNFDRTVPESLPADLDEFAKLGKLPVKDTEAAILDFAIDGWNDAERNEAGDPIREYVDFGWPEEIQKAFRSSVRGYTKDTGISIEDAVALMRPGIVAAVDKIRAAEAAKGNEK